MTPMANLQHDTVQTSYRAVDVIPSTFKLVQTLNPFVIQTRFPEPEHNGSEVDVIEEYISDGIKDDLARKEYDDNREAYSDFEPENAYGVPYYIQLQLYKQKEEISKQNG